MIPTIRSAAVALLVSAAPTLAQFPAEPVGLKVLESRFGDGVTITYKEVLNTKSYFPWCIVF
jgi:hypothetical protein